MKRTIIDPSQMELNENVVAIKRVTKVVKGGRNMRFAALVVVGDGNGHVGAGLGKATEIPDAIRKGKEDAAKNLIEVKLDENKSITHDIIGKHTGASVLLKKAPDGTGIIAGGPARARRRRGGAGPCGDVGAGELAGSARRPRRSPMADRRHRADRRAGAGR